MGHQSISMIWTARAVGTFFACTMSGQAFGSSWMSTTRRKLLYFASAHLIISISMYNIPFLFNLIQTLVCFGFMTFATGSYDVADNGFVHQKFGTKMSRPVIQSLHAFASVGFLSCKSASFIANMFQRMTWNSFCFSFISDELFTSSVSRKSQKTLQTFEKSRQKHNYFWWCKHCFKQWK